MKSMLKVRFAGSFLRVAFVGAMTLGVVAVATAGDGPDTSKVTAFAPPAFTDPGVPQCRWGWQHRPGQPDADVDDPEWSAWDCIPSSWIDAYANTKAVGVQIQGYAWAYNVCAGDSVDPTASISSSSDGEFDLFIVQIDPNCQALITVDLKPKFTARAQVQAPGSAGAAGRMHEAVPILGADLTLEGSVSSDGGVNNSQWSMTVIDVGASVTTTDGIGGGAVQKTFKATDHKSKLTPMATCFYDCTVDVNATADSEGDWFAAAESEAWVWESLAGIDLHGNCPQYCPGFGYVLYNWY